MINEDYAVIPESIVKEAAEACKEDDEINSFQKVLNAGEKFKEAGLTPIYLLDSRYMNLFVVAKETHQKKLH